MGFVSKLLSLGKKPAITAADKAANNKEQGTVLAEAS